MTAKPKTPRTSEAAITMLERYAALDGQLLLIRGVRDTAIAAANTGADTESLPIVAEMDLLRAALEPWWRKNAAELKSAGKVAVVTKMVRARPEVAMLSDAMRQAQSLLAELMLNPSAALRLASGEKPQAGEFDDF